MLAKGRCQHQVDHLSNSHDPETFAYMAALEVSQRRLRDHTLCYGCAACVAYDTNKAAYQVQHVISTCRCPMISTPYERLIKTIRNGGIPLLSIDHTAESGATPQIQVHARKRASKYVAISHVWADGLGNPYANALPLCQIQRLHTHLTALKTVVGANYVGSNGPCLFWMDTLCIPVAEKHSSLRLLQIDKMASIYTGAATTLILDAELMSIVRNAPALSTALRARIACSVWMSRSWTLQEGKLSPSIAVQFANDAVVLDGRLQQDGTRGERRTDGSVEEMSRARELASGAAVPVILEDQLGKGALPSSCDCVDLALERAFLSTLFPNTRSILHAEDFVKAWNELAGRSTTMATDVPIILTNILNFNNREILKYREPAAMFQAILLSMKYLPLGIFFNTGPRHNPSGNHRNRWVPVVVGKERLVEHGELQIFPSYLLYRYWNSDGGTGTPAYMIDGVLRLHSKVYLHAKSRGIYYAVELPLSFTDHFDTAEINSTCILIEGNLLTQDSSIKRGACFYVRNGIRATSSATCEIGPSGIGLIFQSPLRLIQLADAESAEIDHGHAYILSEITSNCDFRISYGKPGSPRVKCFEF